MGFVNDPQKIELFQNNFAEQLRTVWDGKSRVLDIGTGLYLIWGIAYLSGRNV
jgi:hypothetical protein